MPAKKATKTQAKENFSVSLNPFKGISSSRVMYVALLVSLFAIGYLLAKVQMLQGNGGTGSQNNIAAAQPDTGAQVGAAAEPFIAENLENGDLPVKGDENAPVTIVEFSDFECPFCASFYNDTLPQLVSEYIDSGQVKLYYRHYPLSFHPSAQKLAVASECANEQGAFWEMHDKIFENQAAGDFADETITGWAGELGLNTDSFSTCLASDKYDEKIANDLSDGTTAGVDGTPSFFINGERLVGAQPFESFKAVIDSKL